MSILSIHFITISVRSKLSPPYVPMFPSPVLREAWRVCGARSALRRWSCSNFQRRCHRIHCFRTYNGRLSIDVQGRTTFILSTFQTRLDGRDGCFWPAKKEEDSRAHISSVTPAELARAGKLMKASDRLDGGVGGWDGDRETGLTSRRALASFSSRLASRRYKFVWSNISYSTYVRHILRIYQTWQLVNCC